MNKHSRRFPMFFKRTQLAAGAAAAIACLAAQSAQAATEFLVTDASGLSGSPYTGTVNDNVCWNTTSETGTGSTFANAATMSIGTGASDTTWEGCNVNIDLDPAEIEPGGIIIYSPSASANINITLSGSLKNSHSDHNPFPVTVDAGATLLLTTTVNNNGFNWNKEATIFTGGGTIIFQDAFMANGNAAVTNNGPTLILGQTATSNFGSGSGVSFTLLSGALDFTNSTALADAFTNFTATSNGGVNFSGGTVDNLSGSAGTLILGSAAAYTIGGSFIFGGSSSLSLGNNAVTLSGNPTVTINSNTLTIGGIISGASGLTVAGNGTLELTAANTYSGNTTVSGGSLALSGSGSLAGPITVAAGALFDVSQLSSYALVSGQVLSNSTSTAMIAGNINAQAGALSLTYSAGTPSLMSTNGTLTLSSATVVNINNTGAALGVGTYTIIANTTSGNAGSVSGLPPNSVVVTGAGVASGLYTSLQINGGELDLMVTTTPPLDIVSAAAMPSSITRYQSTMLSVRPTNGTAPYTVTVNASSLGGPSSLNLVQDGSQPAGVYVYTNSLMPSGTTVAGNYALPVSVTDSASGNRPGEIFLTITGASLIWNGDASGNNNWANGAVEWQGGLAYEDGDFVRFDDTATGLNPANVNVSTVSPGSVTVNNTTGTATGNYKFSGGEIGGPGSLLKQGSGSLVVDENNTYSGGTTISAGAVQLGNGDGNGTLGGGNVVNDGQLSFDHPGNNQIISNNISGTGAIIEEGNDTLQLAGANTYTGNILVTNNSTLQLGSYSGLGDHSTTTTVANGSTLDINGYTAYGSIIAQGSGVGGNGAINNSSSDIAGTQLPAAVEYVGLTNLTLSGDITIGVGGSRFDLRNPAGTHGNPTNAVLSTSGQPYNIVKVGDGGLAGNAGFFGIVSATVDPALANIDIQNGIFEMEGNTTGLGNPTNDVIIEGNSSPTLGQFQLYEITNLLNKVIVVNDGGTLWGANGNQTIIGPIILTNSSGLSFDCNVNVSGGSLNLAGPLLGNGVLYKETGTNLLILSGDSTNFAGGVEANAGAITVSNVLDNISGVFVDSQASLTVDGAIGGGGVTNSSGGTVSGSGIISNALDSAGTVYPSGGGAPATLTVDGNFILENNSSANFVLNYANNIGMGTNDLIAVNGNVVINGGTINLHPTGLLQDGVPYTIITYTGSLAGNASSLSVSSVNGYNFTVSTSTPGQINVIASGGPPVWNGGSATDSDWSDSANWGGTLIGSGTSLYFSGNSRLNNTNDTSAGSSYNVVFTPTATGAFVLNGTNDIEVTGEIENDSTYTQTVDIPLAFNQPITLAGGSSASAPLIIGAGITNTLSGFNSLDLTGNGVLPNLMASAASTDTNVLAVSGADTMWNIVDNPSLTPISVPWALEITNGTLVFGNASSAPNFTSLSAQGVPSDNQLGYVSGGTATLIISNGTFTTSARMNTGPVGGSTGVVDVVGGTLSVASIFQGANGANTAGSIVNVSGGTFTTPGTFYVASRGVGSLSISGTGMVSCAAVDVSRDAAGTTGGSIGTVNLNGGTLSCTEVSTATANAQTTPGGNAPSATFNFNGGTLLAKASSPTFYQGSLVAPIIPVTTFVQAGGAYINDGGFSIGINEPLQSGAANDGGLTKLGAGTVTLNKTNTYNGPTTILGGTLALGATGNISVSNTAPIIIASNATFNVSALASTFTLTANRIITNSSSTAAIIGNLNVGTGILSLTYAAGTPSLSIGGGTLALAATSSLVINNTSVTPLPVGIYTIITDVAGGTVSGTLPASFTVTGGGTQGGQPVALQLADGALDLVVGHPAQAAYITRVSVNGATLTLTATNGAPNGQYTLLESTNLLLPINQWTPVFTNSFDGSGDLNLSTNVVSPNTPQEFYLLQMP
jgi:fibronectin-binding autotransporter adhesin